MAKNKLTSAELKDLEAIGWSETTPFNVPENISPALKAKIYEAYAEQQGVENPAFDLPDATYRQNEMVRERVAAEEDGHATVRQGDAVAGTGKANPLDHDLDGKSGGHIDNRNKTDKK